MLISFEKSFQTNLVFSADRLCAGGPNRIEIIIIISIILILILIVSPRESIYNTNNNNNNKCR